jgi:tetratricopeptide (TPR) repeat protein/tRNA A-37 threonylcarbamoyl transferase component Bud32
MQTLPTLAIEYPQSVIADRFELESLAGRGGMGTVWKARDRKTGGLVAVKLMTAGNRARFTREAEVLADLEHPRIVRYVAHGVVDDVPYLAMQWLDGIDLAKRLRIGELDLDEAIAVARYTAEALSHAHAQGIVHRDIKPSNLFLADGEIDGLVVLDFGIARASRISSMMTGTGMVIGTPGYMAPEQARGERDLDERADVFSLGCVLFEAVTRRPPFVGAGVGVLAKVLFEEAPRIRDLRRDAPARLESLIDRMMSKRAEERPHDAAAVVDELAMIAEQPDDVSLPGTVLTTGEQRLQSVVVASCTNDPITAESSEEPATAFDCDLVLAPFGAVVERLADGSVIAILAGKGAATDQAAQAARCALALRKLRPHVRMALATGRGSIEGRSPVGEVIDRAVQILAHARSEHDAPGQPILDGSIHLDETTAGLLDRRFDIGGDDAGLVLRGERNLTADHGRRLLGVQTPCVGRERELALLDGVLAESVTDQVAHAVLVTGSPGAGKSRLVSEFLSRHPASRDTGLEVWLGWGDPSSAGSAFHILTEMLRRVCGMLDGEPLAVRCQKLRARVARHVPADDRARVAEFLGELLGCEGGAPSEVLRAARQNPTMLNDLMRKAFEDFVVAECTAHPVIIAIEDLQWGDWGTVKFATGALRRASELPLVVIAAARPEVTQLFPGLWAYKHSTHVQVGDLAPRAGERLIKAVLGELDPVLVRRMIELAGGNAFHLEELIRAVAGGNRDALPPTVLAMVQARLDALDPDVRRVLRAASVFGQQFWAGGVEVLVGGRNCRAWIDDLVERELIEPQGEGRFPGEIELRFRHAIVRDAAYSLLTDDDRTLGHRLAGHWLERKGERDAMTLAEHFAAGGDRAHAASWYVLAADETLAANDFDATIARVRRGLDCVVDNDELEGELHALELEAHEWRNDLISAERAGERALRLLSVGSAAWHDAVGVMASVMTSLGKHDRVIELAHQLETTGLDPGCERSILAWVRVAIRLMFLSEYAIADRLLEPLAAVANDGSAGHNVRGAVLEAIAQRRQIEGDLDVALRQSIAAVDEYRAAGNTRDAQYEQIAVAIIHGELGAFAAAEMSLRELAGDKTAPPTILAIARLNLGLILNYRGKHREAEAIERNALDAHAQAGDRRLTATAHGYLCRILLASRRFEEAVHEGLRAESIADQPFDQALAGASLAFALLAVGRIDEALPRATRAIRILEQLGRVVEGESVIRLAHIETLFATGDQDAAMVALSAAFGRVHERANRITDLAWRAGFLESVPENARILGLARHHGLSAHARIYKRAISLQGVGIVNAR